MELTKIQFEDGQKVSDAYVEINGVKHNVTKAEYTGKTPLSARNLNKLQENVGNAISDLDERVVSYRNVLVDEQALIKECGGLKLKKLNKLVGREVEQETREGYNLLDTRDFETYYIPSGTVALNENGGLNFSDKTDYACLKIKPITLKANVEYTVVRNFSGDYNTWFSNTADSGNAISINFSETHKTITPTEDITINYIRGAFLKGDNYFWLYEGSYSANKIFEQYGKSPTPNFPSEVKTVTGNVGVKVENKNYIDITDLPNWSISMASGYRGKEFNLKPSTNYTISQLVDRISSTTGNKVSYIFATSGKYAGGSFSSGIDGALVGKPITVKTDTNGVLTIFVSNTEIKKEYGLMLEEGTKATDYVEHQSQVLPLTLGDIELCKIGDYADYIYRNGSKWFVHKDLIKISLKSTDNWSGEVFNNVYRVNTKTYNNIVKALAETDLSILSNCFKASYKSVFGTLVSGYIGVYSNKNIYITTQFTETNLQGWKDYLDNNDVYVVLPLETPTDTEITDTTLIAQLNALENAMLYEGITNITITGDNLTPIVDIDYWTWFKGEDSSNVYSTEEQVIGKWIDGKPLYRKVIELGVLPNAGAKTIPHNIKNLKNAIDISGFATDGQTTITLLGGTGSNISIWINKTNIYVNTTTDRSSYTSSYAILDYTKTTD